MNLFNNQSKQDFIENYDAQPAPIFRRFGAVLLDLVFLFILYALLGLASRPILSAVTNYQELNTQLTQEQKKSNLVKLDQELASDYSNIDEVEVVTIDGVYRVEVENYAEATYLFYTDYMYRNYFIDEDTYTHEWYLTTVLKINTEDSLYQPLVVVDGVSIIRPSSVATSEDEVVYDDFLPAGVSIKSTTTPQDIAEYNVGIYSAAIGLFNQNDATRAINNLLLIESSMLFVIGGSVVYLALPLFLRNGQTLGKKLLKLAVTDRYGYRIGWAPTLIRFIAFLLLYILSLEINILIALIIIFVSLTTTVFSKKLRAIHDYIAGTRVIDDGKSTIYNQPEEYVKNHPDEFSTK